MPSSTGSWTEPAIVVAGLEDAPLAAALRARGLNLTPADARRLTAELGRDPSAAELALFDAMWSEHCSYKSTRHLLGTLPVDGEHVILGPGEDAGAVRVRTDGGDFAVVMAHESHNHPSQVLPHEGAATGVGGIIRDVACMGAEVVGVMDALRFGDPTGPNAATARRVLRGVVEGIAHYGDAVGVPNLGGDVEFSQVYDENVLVNVVAFGVCLEEDLIHSRVPAGDAGPYDLILVGKPTDASGLGGASFASVTLGSGVEGVGAVQLPDPFLKRVLLNAQHEVQKALRAAGVEAGYKDLGAGGIGCAASELAAASGYGVEVDLDRETLVPPELAPEFALVAETQERFAWAMPAHLTRDVLKIYNEKFALGRLYPGAGARVLGRFSRDGRFVVRHRGAVVADVPNTLITSGVRVMHPMACRATSAPAPVPAPVSPSRLLQEWAASNEGASRRPIHRFYDSEVRGRAILRPGEADAGVFLLRWGGPEGIAVSVDGSPGPLEADARAGAGIAVCEACRNLAAVGARPLALTDCLNFGNPEEPEVMGDLQAAIEGLGAAARAIGCGIGPLPFISGNVSLYNQRSGARSIPASPIVAAVGLIEDYGRATTFRLKRPGDVLLFVGRRRGSFSGAWISRSTGRPGTGGLPDPAELGAQVRHEIGVVLAGIGRGLVVAAHDVAEGGILWTVAEMTMAGAEVAELGCALAVPMDSGLLEEHCGFVLEVSPKHAAEAEALASSAGLECVRLGEVRAQPILIFECDPGEPPVDLHALRAARERTLEGLLP